MAGILFFKALKSKKDSYILILRPQTSISRCASLTGLACIVALAILTNVTSLFEYKTKVQVDFLRFIFSLRVFIIFALVVILIIMISSKEHFKIWNVKHDKSDCFEGFLRKNCLNAVRSFIVQVKL